MRKIVALSGVRLNTLYIVSILRLAPESGMPEPAKVFEDRHYAGVWRVEWIDDEGGCEIALFVGPKARGES
jgi:hypothetical protein